MTSLRTLPIALLALLPTTLFVAIAPTSEAFGWCADPVPGEECSTHFACVGRSTHDYGRYETCQIGVNRPPPPPNPCETPYFECNGPPIRA